MSFDLFDTLVAARCGGPAGDRLDELFPIAANVAKVKPQDLIVSDFYVDNLAGAERALRTVAKLPTELIVTPDGKASGAIWPGLAKRGVFSHLGDNLESDVKRPREHGISATWAFDSQFTERESYLRNSGFRGVSCAMREARLTEGTSRFPQLSKLQTQVNFPFLILGAIGVLRAAERYGCKTILMSARDCCLWTPAVWSLDKQKVVKYFYTSRIARVFPSDSYLKYVNGLLDEPSLFVDLDGTGWSLRRLIAKTKRPDSPVLLAVRVRNAGQEAGQESLAASVDCPTEHLAEGYEVALEPANYARHPMVKDVDVAVSFTNPTGFDWQCSPEIFHQHKVFGAAMRVLSNYDLSDDLQVSDEALKSTMQTILSWYGPFAGAVDFQAATFQAEHDHVFATLAEQKRTRT